MRISGNCLARIVDDDGRYALLVSKRHLTQSNKILSPIGGGFKLETSGLRYLTMHGARNFEEGNDLRCRVPDHQVQAVIDWFNRRTGRETSVMRELTEELTDEANILDSSDLVGIAERYLGFTRYDAVTTRKVPERQTAYLIEVFDVNITRATMRKLLAAAKLPSKQRLLYFVTSDELKAGVTHDGVAIGLISRAALLGA